MMKHKLRHVADWGVVSLAAVFLIFMPLSGWAAGREDKLVRQPTADHQKFKELKDPFSRGPEVTRACLGCHSEAARQIQQSVHWTWEKKGRDQAIGKSHILNSF